MEAFRGEISQVPPMYSALKHQGKPLYEYARAGIEIEREARRVHIRKLELISLDGDSAVIEVLCSKGTYIRTLACDIGEALGCGAHLTGLRRTATGGFTLDEALQLADIEALEMPQREALLLPADILVRHLPEAELVAEEAGRFMHGQPVRFTENVRKCSVSGFTAREAGNSWGWARRATMVACIRSGSWRARRRRLERRRP